MKRIALIVVTLAFALSARAQIEFSTAGFFPLEGSPRTVESMNPAWRFHKGAAEGAHKVDYNDRGWEVVNLPDGLEILPAEASGNANYRGQAWYRKHFTLSQQKFEGKRLVLYFEAIMGKSKIWVNGELAGEHYGGFLPIPLDITNLVKLGEKNVIAVWADNADDPMYPPGKPQGVLDFCYFGGIYRDCWLIATPKTYITDANMKGKVAGGGLFVSYANVSEEQATVNLSLNLTNETAKNESGTIEFELAKGVAKSVKFDLKKGENKTFSTSVVVNNPRLWSPDEPNLYDMKVVVKDGKGKVIDGYRKKIGVRTFEFNIDKGFILNGKEYPRKLLGANRHQDFALVGNALSNNLHWRDVEKLKGAGMDIIRNAHYPQDPAFMDACDALGMFVIENTPGWQFWNAEPIFAQRVYDDIRQMVRRDRNNPSVIMWEPILNETWYPDDFAQNVHNIIKEEMPYAPNYTVSDSEARGSQHLDMFFSHPKTGNPNSAFKEEEVHKVMFTREFGDNVDDWNSHNSPSRVAVQWGEIPQIIQAQGYAKPSYPYTSIDALYRTERYHVGGTLWHSFDHQRGYHPDPFYGGIMTAFRRPKFSYYMFQSQALHREPMVFIANIMSPFSPEDVTVYSNCEQVRLYTPTGDTIRYYNRPKRDLLGGEGMPAPVIAFPKAFNVMNDKALTRARKHNQSFLLAEGYNDGKLVATHRVTPSRRPTQVKLLVDTLSAAPVADGGDLVVLVAQVTDDNGVVKRLNNFYIDFEVEGEAMLVSDEAAVVPVLWGEAVTILRTTTTPGKVKVKASVYLEGDNKPKTAELQFETVTPLQSMIYDKAEEVVVGKTLINKRLSNSALTPSQREELERRLKEVERQQDEFGEKR